MIALCLVMWPLSWYLFGVSLPLEVRTLGLVLFLQVLTLLSVLHCLPPAGHVEPVFMTVTALSVQRCVAATVNYMTQKRKSCLLAVPPLCTATLDMTFCLGNRCHTSPLPLPAADRTAITSRHCKKCAQKAAPIKKRREE